MWDRLVFTTMTSTKAINSETMCSCFASSHQLKITKTRPIMCLPWQNCKLKKQPTHTLRIVLSHTPTQLDLGWYYGVYALLQHSLPEKETAYRSCSHKFQNSKIRWDGFIKLCADEYICMANITKKINKLKTADKDVLGKWNKSCWAHKNNVSTTCYIPLAIFALWNIIPGLLRDLCGCVQDTIPAVLLVYWKYPHVPHPAF